MITDETEHATIEERMSTVCQRINYINVNERMLSDSIMKHNDQLINMEDMYVKMLSTIIDFKNVIKRLQASNIDTVRDVSDVNSRCDIIDDIVDAIDMLRKKIELLEKTEEINSWLSDRVNILTREIDELKSRDKSIKNISCFAIIVTSIVFFMYTNLY